MFGFQNKILLLSILLASLCKISIGQFNIVKSIGKKKAPFPIEKVREESEMPAIDTAKNQEVHASLPLKEIEFTSLFGWRLHPIDRVFKNHEGVDLKAYYEPVFAFCDGWVVRTGSEARSGNYIVLGHGDGKLESTYAHLSVIGVRPGEMVESGQIIAISGNSGFSTGPHLHFGLKYDGVGIDPKIMLLALVLHK